MFASKRLRVIGAWRVGRGPALQLHRYWHVLAARLTRAFNAAIGAELPLPAMAAVCIVWFVASAALAVLSLLALLLSPLPPSARARAALFACGYAAAAAAPWLTAAVLLNNPDHWYASDHLAVFAALLPP